MCESCVRRYQAPEGGVRPCPATDDELNKLRRARLITDPRKLAALMPAWLKRDLNHPPKPLVFVPDKKPVYPSWAKASPITNEGHRAWIFERFEQKGAAYDSTAEYVDSRNSLNGFKA